MMIAYTHIQLNWIMLLWGKINAFEHIKLFKALEHILRAILFILGRMYGKFSSTSIPY